jgi:general secretion pathway protein H
MIELIVVIAMLAMITALAVPSIRGSTAGLGLRVAAYALAGEMRSARASARRNNIERLVRIDVGQHEYWAEGIGRARRLPAHVGLRLAVPEMERQGPASGRIRFFPDGSSTGGSIVLRDSQREAEVAVDWLSGDVRVRWN